MGTWPYQYPAPMHPDANDPSDPGLHGLARQVVQRRVVYNNVHLREMRVQRADLDMGAVRRGLGGDREEQEGSQRGGRRVWECRSGREKW